MEKKDFKELQRPYEDLDSRGMTEDLHKIMRKMRLTTRLTNPELQYLGVMMLYEGYGESIDEEFAKRNKGGL